MITRSYEKNGHIAGPLLVGDGRWNIWSVFAMGARLNIHDRDLISHEGRALIAYGIVCLRLVRMGYVPLKTDRFEEKTP